MIRFLLFLLFFYSTIFANDITINSDLSITQTENKFYIYEDKSNKLDIKNIVLLKNKFKLSKKQNLGFLHHSVWNYIKVTNNSKKDTSIILANPRAGTDYISVYIFKNKKLIKIHILGDMVNQDNHELLSRKSVFKLDLKANENFDIYTKIKSYGAIDLGWEISTPSTFLHVATQESIIWGIMIGIVLTLCIYTFSTYKIFKDKAQLLYLVFMISSILGQLGTGGIIYQYSSSFSIHIVNMMSFGSLILSAGLTAIFPVYFFQLKIHSPKIAKILLTIGIIESTVGILFFFYPLYPNMLYITPYTNHLIIPMLLTLLYTTFKAKKLNLLGSTYYTIGQVAFLLSSLYYLVGSLGWVETTVIYYFSFVIGTIADMVFMSLAIGQKVMFLKQEKEKSEKLLQNYSKLTFLGQTMLNISHQWKTPINHIYYAINEIEASQAFNDENKDTILSDKLNSIKNSTTMMTETSNNFLDFYTCKENKSTIDLTQKLKYITLMIEQQIKKMSIKVEIIADKSYTLECNKNMFLNVCMIILENSIKQFELNNIKNPTITITVEKSTDKIKISFLDNAGGIKVMPLEDVFKKDESSTQSSGLGLYMAKEILQKKLNGTISASNKNGGALLVIELNS